MSISRSSNSTRAIGRLMRLKPVSNQTFRPQVRVSPVVPASATTPRTIRSFATTQRLRIDILPDADKPEGEVKESEPHNIVKEPTPLTDSEYQEKSDRYFEGLLNRLEEMQEEKGGSLDVEYAAGVLTIEAPSSGGTYVLNKQPPNKQIWLSSPVSGPKRFDYVVIGEGMNQKEGAGSEEWIYLRDGTSLTEILRKELGVQRANDEVDVV